MDEEGFFDEDFVAGAVIGGLLTGGVGGLLLGGFIGGILGDDE